RAGLAGYIDKLSIPQSAEDRMFFRYQVDQPAMERHDVEDAVIRKVVDASAPTHVLRSHRRDAGRSPDIVELHLPVVVHQPVVLRVGDPKIEFAVVLDVSKHRTHG